MPSGTAIASAMRMTARLQVFFIDLPDPEGTGRENKLTVPAFGCSGNDRTSRQHSSERLASRNLVTTGALRRSAKKTIDKSEEMT
jgi:hypothetical protein